MSAYPLRFHPLLKPKVWGGHRLENFGKNLPADQAIGESWELADLPASIPDGRSVIADGPYEGLTLREAIARDTKSMMGSAQLTSEGGFPLLIKYLDANENLSVQVHPDSQYVARHPEAHLKSEAWIVLHASKGSVIYKGVKPGVTPEAFKAHIADGTVAGDLVAVPANAGDCHYLPSGTVHALGAGILVAEVQTPSDTTFRVFDWGRTGRTLHVEQALQCIHFDSAIGQQPAAARPMVLKGLTTTPLVDTEFFAIERIDASAPTTIDVVTSNQPVVWMMLKGSAMLLSPNAPEAVQRLECSPGDTLLLPAALTDVTVVLGRGSTALRVSLPSPTRGMMA